MRRIQSTNSYSNYKNKDKIHKMKYVKDIIQDLEHYGPAGLVHIAALSNIIGRPIKIWNANGSLNKIIGKRKPGQPIDIEYHAIDSEQIGHWTLRGGKDPDNVITDLNSCLFSVIGSQIGQDPLRLRKWTVLKLKDNFQNLVKWIDKIFLQLEGNKGVSLMIGGARYIVSNAAQILDASERKTGQGTGKNSKGHAKTRHVENPVSRYTRKFPNEIKTAFLSQRDQNYVADLALTSVLAQKAMNFLNEGAIECKILIRNENLRDRLPMARNWKSGRAITNPRSIKMVRLILRHHFNQSTNENADVLVHTFHPIISKWIEREPDYWTIWGPPISIIYRPSTTEPDNLVIRYRAGRQRRHYGSREERYNLPVQERVPIEEIERQILEEEMEEQMQKKEVEQQVQEKEVEQQIQGKEIEQQVQEKEIEQQVQEKEIEQQVQEKEIEQQIQGKEIEQQIQGKEIEQQVQEKEIEQQIQGKEIEQQIQGKEIEQQVQEKEIEQQVQEKEIEQQNPGTNT